MLFRRTSSPHSKVLSEYYNILGLQKDFSLDELKKAFRLKARMYHPDINSDPAATDLFIKANEAYLFLLDYLDRQQSGKQQVEQFVDDWKRYRQRNVRREAYKHSRMGFKEFRKKRVYPRHNPYDGALGIYGTIIAVTVIAVALYSFFALKKVADETGVEPSVTFLIIVLVAGTLFFIPSFSHLVGYLTEYRKKRRENEKKDS